MKNTKERVARCIESVGGEGSGLEGVDLADLVICLEEAFGAEIPFGEASKWRTIRDVVKYMETKA